MSKLWARGGSQRHSDDTSTTAMFDEVIWPDDSDLAIGERNNATALSLLPKASNRDKPMAWLTSEVKKIAATAEAGGVR